MLGIHIFVSNLTSDGRPATVQVESAWYGDVGQEIVHRQTVKIDCRRANDLKAFVSLVLLAARGVLAP